MNLLQTSRKWTSSLHSAKRGRVRVGVVTTVIAAKTDDEPIETKLPDNWLKVYPTILPSGNAITIEANEPINGVDLMLLDMQGRHFQSFQLNHFTENTRFTLPMPDLPAGLYLLKANDPTHSFSQKIMIQ